MRPVGFAPLLLAALLLYIPPVARADQPTVPAIPVSAEPPHASASADTSSDLPSKPSILEVITIDEDITDGMATLVADLVKKIGENPRVKAVFLQLDSPGGGVLPSQHIYEELSKLKVPVVAWCDSECASGAMYVAMAPTVKWIAVRDAAISGSIGVIMHASRYNRLLDWAKIDSETYKSGALKDAGNPARAATTDETAYLQSIVGRLAERFYGLVAIARGDKIKDWARVKRAEIFFGQEGVDVGLVDEVMTRDQAIKKAKALSGAATIYTREEMKEMARAADSEREASPIDRTTFSLGDLTRKYLGEFDDLMEGARVTVEYRAPIRF